mgnify:CR=1 FL=1
MMWSSQGKREGRKDGDCSGYIESRGKRDRKES